MDNSSQNEQAEKRRIRKICLLIVIIVITTVVLITETYAWFVGITTVNVDQFTVSVSGGEGLEFSLNASSWTSGTLAVTQSGVKSAYTNNKNKWETTTTLDPISTSGEIKNPGALKLFGKGSLASTAGGYKLISSELPNVSSSTISELDGYIAFDLFIRNGNKAAYITDYNANDDEAIYLSRNSKVVITPSGTSGAGSPDYGLENSVRVAFAQIGRIAANGATATTAQGIVCNPGTSSGVTSLCTNVGTTIWEPNDTAHKAKLINYYNTACKNKTGATSYGSGACTTIGTVNNGTVSNSVFVQTNTVRTTIAATNNVDIYDGLNGYTSSIGDNKFLKATDTFTDTDKNATGDARPEFFKLAANSVTKVRVYIYLEGQDVDNYDLITKGKKINIKFGFTKDKYEIGS